MRRTEVASTNCARNCFSWRIECNWHNQKTKHQYFDRRINWCKHFPNTCSCCLVFRCKKLQNSWTSLTGLWGAGWDIRGDNTNWGTWGRGAGGLEGRVSKWKTWTVGGLAGCTEDRRAGRRAAQKGGAAGCGKGRSSLMCSPPVPVNVQPTGQSCSDPADNSCFSFGNTALQPARPAGPPFRVILGSWQQLCKIKR